MNIFWTSDLHLGHPNIIVYANRPFLKDGDLLELHTDGKPKWCSSEIAKLRADKMNKRIINEINMRCKIDDVLISVGDFCCYGNERGISGTKTKAQEWEEKINPKLIHVLGNHDNNNTVKSCTTLMMCRVSHWNCCVQHVPPWNEGAMVAPHGTNAYICGHVHNKWKFARYKGKPVINIGIDAHNLRPVKQTELINMLTNLRNGNVKYDINIK